jgi:RNA polymerase sigma-70 factor (ECF subfamily)
MQIDRQLLSAISDGDEKTIYMLYRHCYDDLFMVSKRYMSNDDDIGTMINSAFLKIVKNIGQYQSEVPFKAWVRRIMINTAIDHYRKYKKYREIMYYPEEEKTMENNPSSIDFNEADQQFDAEQLLQIIDQLPHVSKTVFNMFAIDGYSHKEIAEMLKISEGTSKWHLSTARKKLRELLAISINCHLISAVKNNETH